MFFFFKQKTAYEMRISDWSSDVCSSDLSRAGDFEGELLQRFGYLAGLMESALSEVVVASPAGKRFLRKLMLRTALVDHGEIETLLENYERIATQSRSEEHTSELQSLMRISYAVFCLKKKKVYKEKQTSTHNLTSK